MFNIGHSTDVPKPKPIPDEVKDYADFIKEQYKHQPIVATEWPPRVGQDFFGRLALIEKQDSITQTQSAWYLLRGHVDKIVKMTGHKEISTEDVLEPTDSSLSLRIVIDGPPGIGKTTLCRKLLNEWSNGIHFKQYGLVLYCPLRNRKIAAATAITDLFEYQRYEVPVVSEWFRKRNGEGLLIIFDGYDELNAQHRQSSLVASIICRKKLDQCAVIVTSRSYASFSLLNVTSISRHVQVIGFCEEEISTVIKQTLQEDHYLAQKLINNKMLQGGEIFTTTQGSKDSQLAVKLINDLEVRGDVRSLCYVPLVCSMVILVYCKEGGHLPTTLTQLYVNFILQTIRRHVQRHDSDPHTLGSLSSLPSQLAKPLEEMCHIAYTNLVNTRMTFFSHELHQLSLSEADYLGLMTTFTEYDEKNYQFLHLSIQEFLAAWWITKIEKKAEEVFMTHFNDDNFRMCLRFVAGLTHLENESYKHYFDKQLDLQCNRKPLFGLETYHLSCFHQNPEIRYQFAIFLRRNFHVSSDDSHNVPILLLQLLYESQNTTLCKKLAQSINNHSLCLDEVQLSLFDWLCLSYFINNSNTTWNHLHLGTVTNQTLSVFTTGLTNNSQETMCKRLEVKLDDPTNELINTLLQPSLLHNIQECYCELKSGHYFPCLTLLQFLNLPQLKVMHLIMTSPSTPTVDDTHNTAELEKCIEMNKTLQEMKIEYAGPEKIASAIISVIKGVTRNKTITSLSLDDTSSYQITDIPLFFRAIEQLLKCNNTLQALSLNTSDELLPSSLNIEVNTPLTALEIGRKSSNLMTSHLPHIKGLHCLILPQQYPAQFLFLSHPSLHTLTLPLDTSESAIKLFNILRTNTTLKALRVEIKERVYTSSIGSSLQDMLKQNQTLKFFEINNEWYHIPIPSSLLYYITTGLIHNTSLQQLSVSIPLPINEEIITFINGIARKKNLTEFEMTFTLDQSYRLNSYEKKEQIMTSLFYEQVLPAITNMLLSHKTIKLLKIQCDYLNESSQPDWIKLIHRLYETIFIHPSLEYIEINTVYHPLPPLLKDNLKDQKKALIDEHKKEQPHGPIPIVNITNI